MKLKNWISTILVFSAFALLFTGCEASVSTGGDTVDADNAADTIKQQYPDKAGGGLTITEISCDEGKAEVDAKFTCTATNSAGSDLEIEATVNKVDEDTDKVNFTWSITKLTATGATFGDVAASTLQDQGYAVASVDCPHGIVVEKGATVDCRATMDNGSTQSATLTLTDGSGGFNIDTGGPGS